MRFFLLLPLCLRGSFTLAQSTPETRYDHRELLIPMRDGINLNTVIYTPKTTGEPLPFLLLRTPYGTRKVPAPDSHPYTKGLADEGYVFVYQDIRGRYKSEGQYEMSRLARNRADPKAIDESTDTYDTLEWLLKNIPNNNGKAGMFGVSYSAWTAVQGAIDPHLLNRHLLT